MRAVIQTAEAACPQEAEADAISEEEPAVDEAGEELMWSGLPSRRYQSPRPKHSGPQRRFVARPIGRFGNWTLVSGERPEKESPQGTVRTSRLIRTFLQMKAFESTGFWCLPGDENLVAGTL